MNKLSLIAAMALGGLVACRTLLATAQDATNNVARKGGKRGFPTVEQRMEKLTTELSLTDEQKPKVKALLEESNTKMKEVMNDSSLDRQQRREKMQPIMDEQNKKMKTILTDDQYKKYQEINQAGMKGGKKKKKAE